MMVARRNVLAALAASSLSWRVRGLNSGEPPAQEPQPREFTVKSKHAMQLGNGWMKKSFNRDDGCGIDIGTPSDISCTGMVGLAMLSQGTSLYEGELYRLVRKTQNYLIKAASAKWFSVNLNTQVKADLSGYADHHFAALLLSQSLGQGAEDRRARRALATLVKQISVGQTEQGDWGQGRYPLLGAVTGWVSLRGAWGAGLSVQASSDATAKLLFKSLQDRRGDLFPLAAGIRVIYALGAEQGDIADWALKTAIKQARQIAFHHMGGEHFLALHFINEVMLQRGDHFWESWYPMVRDKLVTAQNSDGSWTGHSCITSRTFCTACAMLVLTSPNRYLPISEI
jgi:hypothetical protein